MASIVELAAQLQDISAAFANNDRVIAQTGISRSLELTRKSLEKQQRDLEERFLRETEQQGIDVCTYRLFSDNGPPKASALGQAMVSFQHMVSSVYGAVKDQRPRRGHRLSAEAAAESTFDFGYVFPGSVGFVLTIPNKRLLAGGTFLDASIERVFQLSQAETPDQLAKEAQVLGPAPIKAVHRWTEVHVAEGLGADIEWRRALDVRGEVRLQVPEIDHLRMTIEATSMDESEAVTLSAMLRMFNAGTRSFILAFEDDSTIHGVLSEDLALEEPLKVPSRYTAFLTKTTRHYIARGEEIEKWTLDRLEPV